MLLLILRLAEKIEQQHIHKLGEAKVGDTVQVPAPDVYQGPADLTNVLAFITKIDNRQMNYQLETKHGIIAGWHARNKFHICKQKLLTLESLDLNKGLFLREINRYVFEIIQLNGNLKRTKKSHKFPNLDALKADIVLGTS
ncbi:KRAB-A domain-containing 2-like [Brachionus plicatilis]|uniref:KRAB-A domain-containing 2-like n=1 Tax=Brachionus plicatilis TaxID=10195 RepID=A0A3M7PQQ6_BRAPC|nr:KRAB-A domain-containing 2-like [Brachionus plicatilis]